MLEKCNYDTLLTQMSIDFVWVSCCFTIYLEVLLFTNMSCSNLISDKQHLSGLKILPAKLNRRSTGADEAGNDKYRCK